MFSIFKKNKPSSSGLAAIGTDMHSHLLPGIDDGAPDLETSIELIKGLMELGYKKFITTPHIYWELYRNTPETIGRAHQLLTDELLRQGINADISYAAEYYLDDHFDSLLETDAPLLTVKDNWVLVEFSFASEPMDLREKLFAIQMKGYQPILAHPERYGYFLQKKKNLDELRDAGCYFQLNLLSAIGYYGKQPQELAQYLLKNDFYNLLGTDLHHARHLAALSNNTLSQLADKLMDTGRMLNTELGA